MSISKTNSFITSIVPRYISDEISKLSKKYGFSKATFFRFCIEQYLCQMSKMPDEQLEYILKYLRKYKRDEIISKRLEKQINKYCEV